MDFTTEQIVAVAVAGGTAIGAVVTALTSYLLGRRKVRAIDKEKETQQFEALFASRIKDFDALVLAHDKFREDVQRDNESLRAKIEALEKVVFLKENVILQQNFQLTQQAEEIGKLKMKVQALEQGGCAFWWDAKCNRQV